MELIIRHIPTTPVTINEKNDGMINQKQIINKYLNLERATDMAQITLYTIIKNRLFI